MPAASDGVPPGVAEVSLGRWGLPLSPGYRSYRGYRGSGTIGPLSGHYRVR